MPRKKKRGKVKGGRQISARRNGEEVIDKLMAIIRWFVGKIILALDRIFAPTPVKRDADAQKKVEEALMNMEIYQFEACPFCVKVRRFMKAEGISLPLRDAKVEPYRSELIKGGGMYQVPCLKITKSDGAVEWKYESDDIIAFLRNRMTA
jgi:glutaredoxin